MTQPEPSAERERPADLLQRLTTISDEAGRPVFVSLFADLSDPAYEKELQRRRGQIEKALSQDALPSFKEAWDRATKAMEAEAARDGTRGVAVFSAPDHGLLEALGLGAPIRTQLIADASPYVRPLARFLHDHAPLLVVLIDGEDAAVYQFQAAEADLAHADDTSPMGRHRKGGMSQARYQRHRQGVINQFHDEVAQQLETLRKETGAQQIIVAGPGQAKQAFLKRCSKEVQDAVIAVEDADFSAGAQDETLAATFLHHARDAARRRAQQAMKDLHEALQTDARAVVGASETVAAAQAGRVATLLLLPDHKVAAQKCEKDATMFKPTQACGICGEKGNTVDAGNEAAEYVIQNRGEVLFVRDDPFLESVDGMAALLRF